APSTWRQEGGRTAGKLLQGALGDHDGLVGRENPPGGKGNRHDHSAAKKAPDNHSSHGNSRIISVPHVTAPIRGRSRPSRATPACQRNPLFRGTRLCRGQPTATFYSG